MAWGAPLVSLIVTFGFFFCLYKIMSLTSTPEGAGPQLLMAQSSSSVSQIVNIVFGALAAGFAAVINFWLGSSFGSRVKDETTAEVQKKQVQQTGELIREQSEQNRELIRSAPAASEAVKKTVAGTKDATSDRANFDRCVAIVLAHEGGFVDHPQDPGGATNRGITLATLQRWRGPDVKVTVQDVKDLTVDEAKEIFRANYWNTLNCDALPAGVDLVVFDFGVNAGPSRSARMLQKIVAAEADGSIGPLTLNAVKPFPAKELIRKMSESRLDYYRSLSTWDTFGRGWTRRTEETEQAALAMAEGRG